VVKASAEGAWSLVFGALGRVVRPSVAWWSSTGGRRALVVAPHPDDEVAGCGGTILLHRRSGDDVAIVFVTDGRQSRALGLGPEEMARRRRLEAHASARALELAHVEWLGFPEGGWDDAELQRALRTVLEDMAPDVLYAPSRIDFHPEHYRVARCVAATLSGLRAPARVVRVCQLQVPLTPVLVNLVASTGAVMEASTAAMWQYETQIGSLLRCLRMKRYAARFYGLPRQAEEFWELTPEQYCLLHREPPARALVRTFRGTRAFALTDPLAYLRGRAERRRLAQAVNRRR